MRFHRLILILLIVVTQSLLPIMSATWASDGDPQKNRPTASPSGVTAGVETKPMRADCPMHNRHVHVHGLAAAKPAPRAVDVAARLHLHAGCCGHAQCSCGGACLMIALPIDIAMFSFPRTADSSPVFTLARLSAAHTLDRLRPPIRA